MITTERKIEILQDYQKTLQRAADHHTLRADNTHMTSPRTARLLRVAAADKYYLAKEIGEFIEELKNGR